MWVQTVHHWRFNRRNKRNQLLKLKKVVTTDIDIKECFLDAIKTEEVVGALNIDKAIFLQVIDG